MAGDRIVGSGRPDSLAYRRPALKKAGSVSLIVVFPDIAGDANALASVLIFSGSIGDSNINVTTGITRHLLGSSTDPVLDLNSIDVTVAAGGVLTIEFTETGFFSGGATVDFSTDIGIVTANTVR